MSTKKALFSLTLLFLFLIMLSSTQSINENFIRDGTFLRKLKSVNVHPVSSNHSTQTQNDTGMCRLVTVDEAKVRESLKGLIDAGSKLIEIHISFINSGEEPIIPTDGEMYNPTFWVRTSGKYGRSILLLRHSYSIISLGTMSYDVSELNVRLTERPYGCLKQLDTKDAGYLIQRLLLNDFSTDEGQHSFDENEQICNLHIKTNNGQSKFIYECCDISGQCSELYPDFWTMSLTVVIRVVQILAFLYSPLLVPSSWYRSKQSESEYILNLAKPKDMKLKEKCVNNSCVKYVIDDTCGKCVKLNKVRFRIQNFKLIPENKVPVGILSSLHYNLVRCKIRRFSGTRSCCDSSVCGECLNDRICVRWYIFGQTVMRMFMILLITTPVTIWLLEYFLYEKAEFSSRQEAADIRNLFVNYEGSITTLPPDHPFFLVCYALICISLLIMFILKCIMRLMGDKRHKLTLFIIRNAFREMRDSQETKSNIYIGSVISVLWPFKKFGIFALCIYVFIYWLICVPCVLIFISINCFPAITVSFRIVKQICDICFPKCVEGSENCLNLFINKSSLFRDIDDAIDKGNQNQNTRKNLSRAKKSVAFIYAVLCLVLLLACLLIVLECIGFYVQIVMYTIIGVIINASKTLKFMMLAFMIVFYARDCLNGVIDMYLNFNQQITKAVQSLCADEIQNVTEQSAASQENTAFQVNPENIDPELDISCKQASGIRKWEMKRVVLFIDKYDKPFITEKFFFDACNMKYVGCPGPVLPHLVRAVLQILSIVLFLLFVIFVVLAFGDEYISGTNQTLVTLAGGLLPFIFRKILFSPTKGLTVDVNNLNFKNGFNDLINNYVQTWPVSNKYIDMRDCWCDENEDEVKKSQESEEHVNQPKALETEDIGIGMGMGLGAMALVTMTDETSNNKADTTDSNKNENINGKHEVRVEEGFSHADNNEENVHLLSETGNESDNCANV